MYTIGKKKLSDEEISQIKKDWLLILETIFLLKQNISSANLDYKELPESLYLGQKLSNEFDYFVRLHGIPNKVINKQEFDKRKKEASELYKKFYDVFDKINIDEIVKYIRVYLDDSFEKYKMYIENMDRNSEKDVIEMMMMRNTSDILFINLLFSIWVETIWPIVVIRVSGKTLRSLPKSPSEIALQQPIISMALICSPVPNSA